MSRSSNREAAVRAKMLVEKEQLQERIESDRKLKKDFDFLIQKTSLRPRQLITGLWLDCNLMNADAQTLLRNEKRELWPISEDTLRGDIKNVRRMARQIQAINQTKDLSPTRDKNMGDRFSGLPQMLRLYSGELERRVNIWSPYWKRKRLGIPGTVASTREHSLYESIRSSSGRYHQTRLLRLVNVAREIMGNPKISQRAFTIWLNRLEKRRKKETS